MKKSMLVIIVSMLLIIIPYPVSTTQIFENTIYVDDDASPDWYDETHVKTIQEGIDVASDGDTVFIYNGAYQPSTNIHVYKEVTIIGETKEGVIVEHETGSEALSIRAKNVEIRTITFRNFRITNLFNFDNAIITNNVFIIDNDEKHWNPDVLYIVGEHNEISNNIMTFTGTYDGNKNPSVGIFLQCYESSVINNVITGVDAGPIALSILDRSYWDNDFVKGKNIIEGNTFKNNRWGIHLTPTLRPGHNSRIVHNNFIDNQKNAEFIVHLPSVRDIIKKNINRLFNPSDSSDKNRYTPTGLLFKYWDENYWDDYDGNGPKTIPGTLQSAGLINQLFLYVFPWRSFDWHPASVPYNIE